MSSEVGSLPGAGVLQGRVSSWGGCPPGAGVLQGWVSSRGRSPLGAEVFSGRYPPGVDVLQGRVSSGGSGPGRPQAPLGADRCLLGGPVAVTLVLLLGAGRTVTRLFPLGLGRARAPTRLPRGRSASQPELRPSAGRLGGGDPGCIRLCSCSHSGSLHRHREARGGHGLHAGSCQPLPHVPQRPLHARPGGGAPRERGGGPAVVRGGLVHQPHPREEHAAAGECRGAPPGQRVRRPCGGLRRGSGEHTACLGAWAD